MDLKKHTRRDFIRLTGLTAAAVTAAACAPEPQVVERIVQETVIVEKEVEKEVTVIVDAETEPEPEVEAPPEPVGMYNEAPMLAEKVARGELPPVDERLPEEPRVCPVTDRIGEYGGTLTVGDLTMNLMGGDANMAMDEPNLMRISQDATHAIPHVLKDAEISDDFREITCYMRPGMKWSDGEPLTTEDMRYWYEDMLLNTDITPVPQARFRPGGEIMELDILDDYTFKLRFAVPTPAFILVSMAHRMGLGDNRPFAPAHYLQQFHLEYNPDADEVAKEKGFDFWYQLHARENARAQGAGRPRLEAFVPVRDTPSMSFLERNPYYHAVDPEGNQLPYLDNINMDRAADLSVLDAKIVGGTYDFAAFEMRILYYATYAEGAAGADARVILWESGKGGEAIYHVNMNWEDEEWREVFSDVRFRRALSLAVNRKDINDVIYFGNATETAFTVVPVSRHYRPEYAEAYAAYDPDQANALLDEMGLEWNSAGTHRLWPVSKEPMIISWSLFESETPKGPITELMAEYWKDVGIEIRYQSITRTLLSQRVQSNEEPMSTWHGDETMDTLFLRREKWFAPPGMQDVSAWAILWGQWYETFGESGEEPPEEIKDLYRWMDEYNSTDQDEPARKVLESQAENVWNINSVGNAPHPLFVRNNLRNISETGGYWTWDTLWTYPEFPEQWFLES